MQTIYLDISNRGVIPVIYAKQGDVGRKVEVILTNSGLPYEPEAGSAFSAWFSGASGVGNYTDIGEKSAFSVSGNKVTVELLTQMLQNAGEGILCLVLSRANGDQIGLWNIRYICEGIPGSGSEPAKDYYTAFSQAVAGLAYPDASLSVAGKAADAAATGKALTGKAPAGFGLGGKAPITEATKLSDIKETGWYGYEWSIGENPVNGYPGILRVEAIGIMTVQTLYVFSYHNAVLTRQTKTDGTFYDWEWVNPTMELGVEYRTTKRHKGKPVYALMLPGGILAGKTAFSIGLSDRNIAEFVDWRCGFGTTAAVPYDLFQWWGIGVDILYKPTQPAIYGFNNMEGACSDARFYLEYIKTTD